MDPRLDQQTSLQVARQSAGMSVNELAEAAHVTVQFVLHLESGRAKQRTNRAKANQIVKVLGLTIDAISWPNGLTPDPNVRTKNTVDPRLSRLRQTETKLCDYGHIQPLGRKPNEGCELCRTE